MSLSRGARQLRIRRIFDGQVIENSPAAARDRGRTSDGARLAPSAARVQQFFAAGQPARTDVDKGSVASCLRSTVLEERALNTMPRRQAYRTFVRWRHPGYSFDLWLSVGSNSEVGAKVVILHRPGAEAHRPHRNTDQLFDWPALGYPARGTGDNSPGCWLPAVEVLCCRTC